MASDRLTLSLLSFIGAAAAVTPVLPELPLTIRLFLLAGFVGGALADWWGWRLPPAMLTAAALLGTLAMLSRFTWAEPGASFMAIAVVLLAIRLLAEKNRRTYLQLFSLALFILAASSIIRLDALFLVALVTLLSSGMVALVILTASELPATTACPPPVSGRLVMVGLLLSVLTLPLMVAFFLVLPRTQMPFWRFMPEGGSSSGFSEQVQPGKSSTQQLSHRVAFRAEVVAALPPDQLYWRVTVLNQFTGTAWQRTQPNHGNEAQRGGGGTETAQMIYLEPGMGRHLVSLDLPLTISGLRFAMAPDAVVTSVVAGTSRLRYQVTSRPRAALVAPHALDPAGYLDLPSMAAPELVRTGRELRQRFADPQQRLQQIEALFLRQKLRYATSGMATTRTPLDDFFFTLQQGNCEFFASAGAVLLRAAGIPARLVGGYYGGDYQEFGSYYTVTDERAHVWVEALLAGQWQRLDPSRWAVNGAEVGRPAPRTLVSRVRAYADLFEYFWTRTVVTYDLQQQLATADRLGGALASIKWSAALPRALPWLLIPLALGSTIALARTLHLPSREERLLRTLERRIGSVPFTASSCLLTIARQTEEPRVQHALRIYAATLYRGRRLSPTRYRRLRKLIRS